jgi:hypothetical protein
VQLFAPLEPGLEPRFVDDITELNRRRLRVLAPIMLALHMVHLAIFYTPPSARATLGPEIVRWRDLLVLAHSATIPLTLLAAILAYRPRRVRWLGALIAFVYLQHGAWVAGIDQIVSNNISVYIGYCFGIAVVVALTPRASVIVYLAGAASLVLALLRLAPSSGSRQTNLPTCLSLTVVSIAFSWFLYGARRREFSQRITIDRQRDELSALNASLSQRVDEQVAEIVQRATEVDRLNAQLRAQVRARSDELSLALSRLANERRADGTLPIGVTLGNRFEVAERIGKGGMGTVYRGVDWQSGERVAIKVIQAGSIHQLDAMRRFIREVGLAATVTHPAVVRMLHVDVSDDGLLYQVQDFVEGATLTSLMGAPWTPGEAARLGAVLCDALAAAHAVNVVHRDVKPDNLMLTSAAPGLKLLDFGIAKLYQAVAGPDVTTERIIIGTPGYMAPEQSDGNPNVSDRADLFAVGVLLFQLLHGRLPGDEKTQGPLGSVIDRCLEDAPAKRPSAAELRVELTRFADEQKVPSLEVVAQQVRTERGHTVSDGSAPTTPHRPG